MLVGPICVLYNANTTRRHNDRFNLKEVPAEKNGNSTTKTNIFPFKQNRLEAFANDQDLLKLYWMFEGKNYSEGASKRQILVDRETVSMLEYIIVYKGE